MLVCNDRAIYIGSNEIKKVYSGTNVVYEKQSGGLPSEYQEVTYIESHATEYINTRYHHKNNTKYVLDLRIVSTNATYNTFFGARTYWSNSDAYDVGYNLNNFYVNIGKTTLQQITRWYANTDYHIEADKTQVSFNNSSYSLGSSGLTSNNLDVYIFILNNNNSLIEPSKIKLYNFEIYEDDVLVKKYVPCYRKSDGVIGLYEIVDKEFLTNSGTGTFEKGADVN